MKKLTNCVMIFRLARGMTQAELAEAAGLTQSTVSDIEAGRVDPRLGTMCSLAVALQTEKACLIYPPEVLLEALHVLHCVEQVDR